MSDIKNITGFNFADIDIDEDAFGVDEPFFEPESDIQDPLPSVNEKISKEKHQDKSEEKLIFANESNNDTIIKPPKKNKKTETKTTTKKEANIDSSPKMTSEKNKKSETLKNERDEDEELFKINQRVAANKKPIKQKAKISETSQASNTINIPNKENQNNDTVQDKETKQPQVQTRPECKQENTPEEQLHSQRTVNKPSAAHEENTNTVQHTQTKQSNNNSSEEETEQHNKEESQQTAYSSEPPKNQQRVFTETTSQENEQSCENNPEYKSSNNIFHGDVITDENVNKYDWLHLNIFPNGITTFFKCFIIFAAIAGTIISTSLLININSSKKKESVSANLQETEHKNNAIGDLISNNNILESVELEDESEEIDNTDLYSDEDLLENSEEWLGTDEIAEDETLDSTNTSSSKFENVSELTLYIQSAIGTIEGKQVDAMTNLTNGNLSKKACKKNMQTYNEAISELSNLLLVNKDLYDSDDYDILSSMISKRLKYGQISLNYIDENAPYSEISEALGLN